MSSAPSEGSGRLNGSASERRRFIAFYLPQFHPIPENDEWWGKGFTDWTNVARARPLFHGHQQPHLPADLGFYDLRLPEARAAQAALATEHGIDGFCYYHYWFEGLRLLERPFDEVLQRGDPSLPFCLCWANENWTRAWSGEVSDVLLQQTYSPDDDLAHIRWLTRAFADPRYIRVSGRPLFLVYRATSLPDAARTTETWRNESVRLGTGDPYLCLVQGFESEKVDPGKLGFDAAVRFAPDWRSLGRRVRQGKLLRAGRKLLRPNSALRRHKLFDYRTVVELSLSATSPPYKLYPCVSPGFDNSPRRPEKRATVLLGSSPSSYEHWLSTLAERFEPFGPDEDFVFVNAWNEWGEGNHLEPCQRWGRGYLEAHSRVANSYREGVIAGGNTATSFPSEVDREPAVP